MPMASDWQTAANAAPVPVAHFFRECFEIRGCVIVWAIRPPGHFPHRRDEHDNSRSHDKTAAVWRAMRRSSSVGTAQTETAEVVGADPEIATRIAIRIEYGADLLRPVHDLGPGHRVVLADPAGEHQRIDAAQGRDQRSKLPDDAIHEQRDCFSCRWFG